MNEIIKFGPFLIQYKILVAIIAGLIGYWFLKLRLKKVEVEKTRIFDSILGTVFIALLVWKFGGVLFNPSLIWRNPVSILFLIGNEKTFILSICASAIYLFYKIKKARIPIYTFLDILPFGFLPYLMVYNFAVPSYGGTTKLPWGISIKDSSTNYHPINIYMAIIILCLIIFIWKRKEEIGSGGYFSLTVTILGLAGLLLSFLSIQSIQFLGISYLQMFYILLLITGYTIPWKEQKREAASGHSD